MLGPEDHSCILTTAEFGTLLRVSQHPHVFLQSCWKHLQEILIDFLKFLQRKILQTEGSSLNYAADIIFLHIESEDLNEPSALNSYYYAQSRQTDEEFRSAAPPDCRITSQLCSDGIDDTDEDYDDEIKKI